MDIRILAVSFLLITSLLLGFALLPSASADVVSWNGFLQKIGFDPPTVYEVSDSIVIPAGDTTDGTITLSCLDGDWLESGEANFVTDPAIFVPAIVVLHDTNAVFMHDPASISTQGNPNLAKRIGYSVQPELIGSGTPLAFDVTVTVTVHCTSPSSFMAVGGVLQPTDTTALLIGYSVLNAYWLAPTAIGIGVGIYLVKRRF